MTIKKLLLCLFALALMTHGCNRPVEQARETFESARVVAETVSDLPLEETPLAAPLKAAAVKVALETGVSGLRFGPFDRSCTVAYVAPKLPADKAGIKVGDHLDSIDGEDADLLSGREVWLKLVGTPGSKLKMVINGKEVEITRMRVGDIANTSEREDYTRYVANYVVLGNSGQAWEQLRVPTKLRQQFDRHPGILEIYNDGSTTDKDFFEGVKLCNRINKAGLPSTTFREAIGVRMPATDPALRHIISAAHIETFPT